MPDKLVRIPTDDSARADADEADRSVF